MSQSFNYRHLYYFWVVAKEGGLTRAAERLDMSVQTISAQVRKLEEELGHALLKPQGRNLVLTEAGVAAMREADHIFELGQLLPSRVREAASGRTLPLRVGISDGVAKWMVHRLLGPVLAEPHLRLLCHEGEFGELLAELALHKLDTVISDRPDAGHPALKLDSYLLASSRVAWYAPKALATGVRRGFPHSLAEHPVLLPTAHSTVRPALDQWFEREHIEPRLVGEFEDSAMLSTFGALGMGVFPAAEWLDQDRLALRGLAKVGACPDVLDHIYLTTARRKVLHPLVARLLPA